MNISRAAKALDVNDRTLKLWIARPEFVPFFSDAARREGAGRDLNDDDIIVANTIRSLRAGVGNNNVDWQSIADELAGNYRDRKLPETASTVNSGLSIVAQQERMASVVEQRDSALMRVNELRVDIEHLRSDVTDLQDARRADVERLLREQQSLAEKLARAEIELEMWRTGRLKPE